MSYWFVSQNPTRSVDELAFVYQKICYQIYITARRFDVFIILFYLSHTTDLLSSRLKTMLHRLPDLLVYLSQCDFPYDGSGILSDNGRGSPKSGVPNKLLKKAHYRSMSTVQRDLYLPSEWNLTGCTLVYREPLH